MIRVAPENHASAAVARRAGFRYAEAVTEPDGSLLDRYLRDLAPAAAGH